MIPETTLFKKHFDLFERASREGKRASADKHLKLCEALVVCYPDLKEHHGNDTNEYHEHRFLFEDTVRKFVKHGYAPGSYLSLCNTCGVEHVAAKRASTCFYCAFTKLMRDNSYDRD